MYHGINNTNSTIVPDELMDQNTTTETPEPTVTFRSNAGIVVEFRPSGIFYNRTLFPSDTSLQAAQRVYDIIKPLSDALPNVIDVNFTIIAWKQYPERTFCASPKGIQHNFDVDTWHWWMLEHLTKLVTRKLS
jgi:hypothetical protein